MSTPRPRKITELSNGFFHVEGTPEGTYYDKITAVRVAQQMGENDAEGDRIAAEEEAPDDAADAARREVDDEEAPIE